MGRRRLNSTSARATLVVLGLVALSVFSLAACGESSTQHQSTHATLTQTRQQATVHTVRPAPPAYPMLLRNPLAPVSAGSVPVVALRGQPAVWIARTGSGVTLLSFSQSMVSLALHSGTADAGALGWRYGPAIAGPERRTVVAAFNGGFKLDTGAGGFESYGRTAVPLQNGLASIVTYTDGYTAIAAWHKGVPAPGRGIASVRQNLTLLVDNGRPASSVSCDSCWGATLGGVADPARAALGITPGGRLVWAGGENLTVSALADAMTGAGVVRAVELDINPEWVAAYLYSHRNATAPPIPHQAMPGQSGIPGQFLQPYSRDFFTVHAR